MILNRIKCAIMAGAGALVGAGTALAQSETPTFDTTEVENMATSIKTGLTSMMGTITPILVGVVLIGLVWWLGPIIIRAIKKWFGSGQGR